MENRGGGPALDRALYDKPERGKRWAGFEAFDKLIADALGETEPDNVVDLNANVVDIAPPDDAA